MALHLKKTGLKASTKKVKKGASSKSETSIKTKTKKKLSLPPELEDTKKIGTNLRVKYDVIGGDNYVVLFIKTDVKGELSKSGSALILGKTDKFASLEDGIGLNLMLTRRVQRKRKRDDDDDE